MLKIQKSHSLEFIHEVCFFLILLTFFMEQHLQILTKKKGTKISSVKKIVRNMKEWQEIEI